MISITTSGRDAVLLKSIYVENSAPQERIGPSKDTAKASEEMQIGSEVIIQSGKYTGVLAKLKLFLPQRRKRKSAETVTESPLMELRVVDRPPVLSAGIMQMMM